MKKSKIDLLEHFKKFHVIVHTIAVSNDYYKAKWADLLKFGTEQDREDWKAKAPNHGIEFYKEIDAIKKPIFEYFKNKTPENKEKDITALSKKVEALIKLNETSMLDLIRAAATKYGMPSDAILKEANNNGSLPCRTILGWFIINQTINGNR